MTDPDSSPPIWIRRWSRARSWGITVCIVVAATYLMRRTILASLALPLIYSDPSNSTNGILVINGENRFSEAVQFHQENPAGDVLLIEYPKNRLERYEIVARRSDRIRDHLIRCGIDAQRIAVIDTRLTDESACQNLARWLTDHPDSRLQIVCKPSSSREVRWRLDRDLPAKISKRVVVRPLVSRSFHPSRWWKSENGISLFVEGWLGLIRFVVQRGREIEWRECNPEIFQPATA